MSSTNMVYAFAHDGAFLRTTATDELQLIRDGVAVFETGCHANRRVSVSTAGIAVFDDGYGTHRVSLDDPSPVPLPDSLSGLLDVSVHPDGDRVLTYDTDTATLSWLHFDEQREAILTLREDELVAYPEVALAPDGETWALLDSEDVAIGRAGRLLTFARLADVSMDFYPRTYAFDLAFDRFVLSGAGGLLALSWQNGARTEAATDRSFVGPLVAWDGAYVAVARAVAPDTFEVVRLDPVTLEVTGVVDGFGCWRDPDGSFGILAPADGSLVVVPSSKPLRILAADGTTPTAGPLAEVMGAPRADAVPHPVGRWYDQEVGSTGVLPGTEDDSLVGRLKAIDAATPGRRKSLARFLLDDLADERLIDGLLRRDPDAFIPYASLVAGWDDGRVAELFSLVGARAGLLANGADDDAADRLAARVRAAAKQVRVRLFALLIGVDSEHALALVGVLAREKKSLRKLARQHGLATGGDGPAQRRFATPAQEVVAGTRARATPGLSTATPTSLPRGVDCALPPAGVLSVTLSLLPGDPLATSPSPTQVFWVSDCEDCDEPDAHLVTAGGELLGALDPDGRLRAPRKRPTCAGASASEDDDARPEPRLALKPQVAFRREGTVLARLGGRPEWVQSPSVPKCPRCKQLAFFVGQATPEATGGPTVFGFHCEHCGVAIQVAQRT